MPADLRSTRRALVAGRSGPGPRRGDDILVGGHDDRTGTPRRHGGAPAEPPGAPPRRRRCARPRPGRPAPGPV